MRHRLPALLLNTLLVMRVQAQELRIYLNTNDCINCISAIAQLDQLDEEVHIDVVCDEAKKRFLPALLEQYGLRASTRTTITYVPSEALLKAAPVSGRCIFSVGNSVLFAFDLRELSVYLPAVHRSYRSYRRSVHRPLATGHPLGDRLTIFPAGEQVLVQDYLFQKAYLAALSGTDTVHLLPSAPSDSLTRAVMSRMVGDLRVPDSLDRVYDGPEFEHEILAVNTLGEGFQIGDVIHYPVLENGGPIKTMKFAYFNWKDGRFSVAMYGNWISLEPYLMVLNFGYRLTDSLLTTVVLRKEVSDAPLPLLVDFDRVADSIAFRGFRKLMCPPALQAYGSGYSHVVYGLIREGYYGTLAYPLLYDLTNDQEHDLGKAISPTTVDWFSNGQPLYTARDVLDLGNGMIMLLYQLGDATVLAWIDLDTDRIMRRVTLATGSMDLNTMRLLDDGRVIGFSTDYQAFVILE